MNAEKFNHVEAEPPVQAEGADELAIAGLQKLTANHAVDAESEPTPDLAMIDTAEILAAKEEKLKKGIKVVIGGPPHSGKSVFIEALMQNLDKDHTYSFSAAPDGEGAWLQKYYDNPDVVKLRQKGKFTPEFVADRKRKIADWEGPLMLIDIGGRTSPENAEMIQGATHAIILAGDLSKVSEWRDFFEDNHIDVVAKLHSHYHGSDDVQRPMEAGRTDIVSSVHHLERGEPAADRTTIKQVAHLLSRLVDSNLAYQESHEHNEINSKTVQVSEVFNGLPSEIVERRFPSQDGQTKVVHNRQVLRSAIPMIYEKAKALGKKSAWIDGPANSWESMSLALAFEDAGSQDVRLRSPDGFVSVKPLPEAQRVDSKWWEEPKLFGEKDGKPIYIVHNTAHVANNPISPQDLDHMSIPQLPEDAIVVVSTQGPNWLRASIASGYKGKVDSIAAFVPGEGATIAWAKDKRTLGEVVG